MGHPEQLIKEQVARTPNNNANNSQQEKEIGVSLVTTHHPRLKDKIIA